MQLLTLFSVFFLFLDFTFSSDIEICAKSNPCACTFQDGTSVELSNIGQPGNPRFVLPEEEKLLLYNPCYPFSYNPQLFKADKHPCSNAAACFLLPGNNTGSSPMQQALGLQETAVFFRENDIIKVNYSVLPNTDVTYFTVILECNQSIPYRFDISASPENQTIYTLTTYCACKENNVECKSLLPAHSKSGLSTGSILLITFFVVILVYLGMGILFNFCKGAHGTELLPNSEFWNELPKLIADGFLFTCSCFGRRASYGGV